MYIRGPVLDKTKIQNYTFCGKKKTPILENENTNYY